MPFTIGNPGRTGRVTFFLALFLRSDKKSVADCPIPSHRNVQGVIFSTLPLTRHAKSILFTTTVARDGPISARGEVLNHPHPISRDEMFRILDNGKDWAMRSLKLSSILV